MFYIDFTSPEGKTYRIDVSKNPVTYECPVCGEKTIYVFGPEELDYCYSCYQKIEEKRMADWRRRKKTAKRLNKEYDLDITPYDLERLESRPDYENDPDQALEAYVDGLFEERIKERRLAGEISPQVQVLYRDRVL